MVLKFSDADPDSAPALIKPKLFVNSHKWNFYVKTFSFFFIETQIFLMLFQHLAMFSLDAKIFKAMTLSPTRIRKV